jgi:hypothetical protein
MLTGPPPKFHGTWDILFLGRCIGWLRLVEVDGESPPAAQAR